MTIFRCRYPDVKIRDDVTYHDYVMENLDEYGDDILLVDGITGRSYTARQLKALVRRVGSALTRRGFKRRDVFCVFAPNLPEFAIIQLAVISIGGILTTANPLYTPGELSRQLADSTAKYIITIPMFADTVNKAAENYGKLQAKYVFGEADGFKPFTELMQDDGSAFPTNLKFNPKEDIALLPYSSGTTGVPKGVMLTHYSLVANYTQIDHAPFRNTSSVRRSTVLILPLFHLYGIMVIAGSIRNGTKVVTLPRFEQEQYLRAVEKYRASSLNLVPPLVLFLAKSPLVSNYDLSCVEELGSGAAPLGKELTDELIKRLGGNKTLRQGYGLTETSPVVTTSPRDKFKYGSAGMIIPNTEIKFVDISNGRELGVNEDGELWCRGPQNMKGYWNRPDSTAATLDKNGWLHTGDIGHIDEDGCVFIVDRLKELIKYKGFQVPPAELEALLIAFEGVADVAVIGVPDLEAGELPRAYIVKKPGAQLSEETVKKFIARECAPHKRLRGGVRFVSEIPKSPSGKILRRLLRDQLKQEMKAKL
ncbi:unnamed protein product [Owenia fusiformis]|uniref:Luciferin 4-monooxygenase n=1 Tax=Owenia fusiformis TaxID=6347 RepID=A0A8J1U2Y1_OWEFU|nr:unnamed protein product [Owenia fusiformis]